MQRFWRWIFRRKDAVIRSRSGSIRINLTNRNIEIY